MFEASFVINSRSVDPERMTELLGIKPTEQMKKGDPLPVSRKKATVHTWILESGTNDYRRIPRVLEGIVKAIHARKRALARLPKSTMMYFRFATYRTDSIDSVVLMPKVQKLMQEIGVPASFSCYFLGPSMRWDQIPDVATPEGDARKSRRPGKVPKRSC